MTDTSPDLSQAKSLQLLIKLLKMTTSTADGEALAALRAANKTLLRLGWDWEKLLHGKVTIVADPFDHINVPPPSASRSYTPTTSPTPPPQPPPWSTPSPPPPPPQRNLYAAHCIHCSTFLIKGQGELTTINGKTKVMCWGAKCPPKPTYKPAPKSRYQGISTEDL